MMIRIEDRGSRIETRSGVVLTRSSILDPLSSKGFTLIELLVVVVIIAVLYTVLLDRVSFYQERAEKTAMMEVEGALQSALVMQYGRLILHGSEADIAQLATENPMKWLMKPPANYAGEFYEPQPSAVEPGSWVFDLKTHELVFILNRADYFIPGADGQKWVRYHVNLKYDPVLGIRNTAVKELVGALFEPVESYKWFD